MWLTASLIPMINEAAIVLEEGLASAEDIDKSMKLGCNHPMGPLALGDRSVWIHVYISWIPSMQKPVIPNIVHPVL